MHDDDNIMAFIITVYWWQKDYLLLNVFVCAHSNRSLCASEDKALMLNGESTDWTALRF